MRVFFSAVVGFLGEILIVVRFLSGCVGSPPAGNPLSRMSHLISPTNVVHSFLHPSSFHDQLPLHVAVLKLSTIRWSSFEAWLGLVRAALLLSTLHTRALLPISSSETFWPASLTSFSRLAGRPLACPPPPALMVCHCGLLMLKSRVSK